MVFTIENGEEVPYTLTYEFKLTGYALEEPGESPNTWSFVLQPQETVQKRLVPYTEPSKKKAKGGMLGGLMDAYESAERGYTFKATAEAEE